MLSPPVHYWCQPLGANSTELGFNIKKLFPESLTQRDFFEGNWLYLDTGPRKHSVHCDIKSRFLSTEISLFNFLSYVLLFTKYVFADLHTLFQWLCFLAIESLFGLNCSVVFGYGFLGYLLSKCGIPVLDFLGGYQIPSWKFKISWPDLP